MLHRNMSANPTPDATSNARLALDDVLGDLHHARRSGNVGRLALVAYCEVRRWARQAGEQALAEHSTELVMQSPHESREQFLRRVDALINELELVRQRLS